MNDFSRSLADAVEGLKVTGASLAYWDGAALHTAVAGVRNSVTRDPVTVDTVMHIGSITKVLNAVLLMQLVDEGRMSLDDTVIEHLPELRLRDEAALRRITCGMLLDHSSGIDGDWLPDRGPDQERIVDAIERCADLGQLFAPGEATSYCNIATVIAGYLTQKLRATSWYTAVKTRLFEPLTMRHSLAEPIDAPRFRCSVGDLTDPTTGLSVQARRPFLSPSFAPAGSTLMTSATDLVTFARALVGSRKAGDRAPIISEASAKLMMEPRGEFAAPHYQIGLGWMIAPGGVLTHTGVGPGVNSTLFADPQHGRVVALLTNCDRGGVLRSRVLEPIVASWSGIKKSASAPHVAIDAQMYEGVYENNLQRVEVRLEEAGLTLRVEMKMRLYDTSLVGAEARGQAPLRLRPRGDHAFETDPFLPRGTPGEVRFSQLDGSGRMRFLGMRYRLLARTT